MPRWSGTGLHFLDQNHEHGGHALDYVLTQGEIEISTASELHLALPRTEPFLTANLTSADTAAQIRQTEGG